MPTYLLLLLLALLNQSSFARSIDEYQLFHVTLLVVPGALSDGHTKENIEIKKSDNILELPPNSIKMHFVLGEVIKDNYKQLLDQDNGGLLQDYNFKLFSSDVPGASRSLDALAASLLSNKDVDSVDKTTKLEETSDHTNFPPFFGLKESYQTPTSGSEIRHQIQTLNISHLDLGSSNFLEGKCSGFFDWMHQKLAESKKSFMNKIKMEAIKQELVKKGYSLPSSDSSPELLIEQLRSLFQNLLSQKSHLGQLPPNVDSALMDKLKELADVAFSLQVLPTGPRGDRSKTATHELGLELLRGFAQMLSLHTKSRGLEFLTSMHRCSDIRVMYLSPLALHSLTTNLGLSSTECLLEPKPKPEAICLPPPGFASNWAFELYKLKNRPEVVFVRARYDGKLVNVCGLDSGISKDLFCPYALFQDILRNTLLLTRDWRDAPSLLNKWGFCPHAHN